MPVVRQRRGAGRVRRGPHRGPPSPDETQRRLDELSAWHDTSLDWDDSAGPGPWTPEEYARFDAAAAEVLESIRVQLGPDFQVDYMRL